MMEPFGLLLQSTLLTQQPSLVNIIILSSIPVVVAYAKEQIPVLGTMLYQSCCSRRANANQSRYELKIEMTKISHLGRDGYRHTVKDHREVSNIEMISALSYYIRKNLDINHLTNARYNYYTNTRLARLISSEDEFGIVEPLPDTEVKLTDDISMLYQESYKTSSMGSEKENQSQIINETQSTVYTLYSNTSVERIREFLHQIHTEYNAKLKQLDQVNKDNNIYYYVQRSFNLNEQSKDASKGRIVFNRYRLSNQKNFSSLFIPEISTVEKLIQDFLHCTGPFQRPFIAHKLTFLLYGPPGCGKTSFIKALANTTHRHVVNVPLEQFSSDSQLVEFFYNTEITYYNSRYREINHETYEHPQIIFVLEEIDILIDILEKRTQRESEVVLDDLTGMPVDLGLGEAPDDDDVSICTGDLVGLAFEDKAKLLGETLRNQGTKEAAKLAKRFALQTAPKKQLTLKGFLETLDGVFDAPGRIVVITTNHPEKLDQALLRHGRVNMRLYMGKLKHPEMIKMIEHFYQTTLTPEQVASLPAEDLVAPSTLEQYMMEHPSLTALLADSRFNVIL